jgi:hypothetical protein
MQEPSGPPASRVSAAIALLDRGWGKFIQAVEMDLRSTDPKYLTDEEPMAIAAGDATYIGGSKRKRK